MVEHACCHVIQVYVRPQIPRNALVLLGFLNKSRFLKPTNDGMQTYHHHTAAPLSYNTESPRHLKNRSKLDGIISKAMLYKDIYQ